MQASVSFSKETKATSIKHNNRDFDERDWNKKYHAHIDRERTKDNVIFSQENIREKYEEIFGKSVVEYNAKQKRSDRKIDDYYTRVLKDKKLEPQREFVIQIGDIDMYRTEDDEGFPTDFDEEQVADNWKKANEILKEYVKEFKERNPNLVIYNAIIHNDEASPHLHLNVIPVAEGYKRGVQKQPSFNKALKQQGIEFEANNNRSLWNNFRDQEVDSLERLMLERGIERQLIGTNRIKDMHQYKEAMEEVREIKAFANKLDQETDILYDKAADLKRNVEGLEKIRSELLSKALKEEFDVKRLTEQKKSLEDECVALKGAVEHEKVKSESLKMDYEGKKRKYKHDLSTLESIRNAKVDIESIEVVEQVRGLGKKPTGKVEIDKTDWHNVRVLAMTTEAIKGENEFLQKENKRLEKEKEKLEESYSSAYRSVNEKHIRANARALELGTENTKLKEENKNLERFVDVANRFFGQFNLVTKFKEFTQNLRKEQEQKRQQEKKLEEQRRKEMWKRQRDSGGLER